jgi:hypothetical protein
MHPLQVLALLQQLTALPAKSQMRDACTALLAQPVADDVAAQLSTALQQLDLSGGTSGCLGTSLSCVDSACLWHSCIAQLLAALQWLGPAGQGRVILLVFPNAKPRDLLQRIVLMYMFRGYVHPFG